MADTRRWVQTANHEATGLPFNIHVDLDAKQMFADGVAGLSMGASTARLELYNVKFISSSPTGAAIENREVETVLNLPTVNLVEFCINIVKNVLQNEAALDTGPDQLKKILSEFLSDVKGR